MSQNVPVLHLFNLTGKVALVTGGGRGLGRQIALGFAEAGADLILCSRKVENCEAVASEIRAMGRQVLTFSCNVTNAEDVERVVAAAHEHFGRIDILVNNSGASWGAPAIDMPLDAWNKIISTNLTGTFLMSQAVAKRMIPAGGGKILNIASVAGLRGSVPEVLDAVAYNASKGGVITLTKDLAVKWARHQIYVNALAPGFFPSDMTKVVIERGATHIIEATPLHKVGGENDLKGAALFFVSPASDFVTGQILAVDGGSVAR